MLGSKGIVVNCKAVIPIPGINRTLELNFKLSVLHSNLMTAMVNLPFTSTLKVQSAFFPTSSVTLYCTVFSPIPSSFGRVVDTFFLFIVSMTVNELFVMPGSFWIKELSVNEKSQLTNEPFFPLSLSLVKELGHVKVGGLKSDRSKKINVAYV